MCKTLNNVKIFINYLLKKSKTLDTHRFEKMFEKKNCTVITEFRKLLLKYCVCHKLNVLYTVHPLKAVAYMKV